jgi:hypothetical protein
MSLDGGAADTELDDDHGFDIAGRVLATGQHLDDPSPNRLGHRLIDMHVSTMSLPGDVTP